MRVSSQVENLVLPAEGQTLPPQEIKTPRCERSQHLLSCCI